MGFNPYSKQNQERLKNQPKSTKSSSAFRSDYNSMSRSSSKNNKGGSKNTGFRGGNSSGYKSSAAKSVSGTPRAPYNFVPLNDTVLQAPAAAYLAKNDKLTLEDKQQAYKDFLKGKEPKFSGYFDVELTNLTPLYIAGQKGFFFDGKNYCVPGSSLRGCIKNYFKIITNGTLRTGEDPDVTDKILYYRSFASAYHPLRDIYHDEMTKMKQTETGKKIDVAKSEAGFLVREGKEFFICPATLKRIKDERQAQRVTNDVEWGNTEVEVYTGPMHGKKHYYCFANPRWQIKLSIPEKVMNGYRDDKNRKGIDLLNNSKLAASDRQKKNLRILDGAENYDYIIPCFFVADDKDTVQHFGFGPLYRIPYKKSIGEHIPKNLKEDKIDFAAALFGNKEAWGSRVFFENLYLQDKEKFMEQQAVMIPLMGPNPTSFQNYLQTSNGKVAHWNIEGAPIRGYKLYWHKKCDWRRPADAKNTNENVTKKIAPVAAGNKFCGRIRFESLTAAELGALAKTLSLCDGTEAAYKLGMGKSIGMGSVKLDCRLYVQDETYYTKLFGKNGLNAGVDEHLKEEYIDIFDNYLNEKLGANAKQLYKYRMLELALIMDSSYLSDSDWAKKVGYMDLNDKEERKLNSYRIALPSISEVVKNKK